MFGCTQLNMETQIANSVEFFKVCLSKTPYTEYTLGTVRLTFLNVILISALFVLSLLRRVWPKVFETWLFRKTFFNLKTRYLLLWKYSIHLVCKVYFLKSIRKSYIFSIAICGKPSGGLCVCVCAGSVFTHGSTTGQMRNINREEKIR